MIDIGIKEALRIRSAENRALNLLKLAEFSKTNKQRGFALHEAVASIAHFEYDFLRADCIVSLLRFRNFTEATILVMIEKISSDNGRAFAVEHLRWTLWDSRKGFSDLSDLKVPGFIRTVYKDLKDGGPRLPDGRAAWHLVLPNGIPVWQKAIRDHDARGVQILRSYISSAVDAKQFQDLLFENKIDRRPSRPTSRAVKNKTHKRDPKII